MSHLEKLRKFNRVGTVFVLVAGSLCFGGKYLYQSHRISNDLALVMIVSGLCVVLDRDLRTQRIMK